MKRMNFLAAMLVLSIVFGGCEQATDGGKLGMSEGTAYTSEDGSGTRLVLTEIQPAVAPEVQSSGNEGGAAYSVSAPKIGEAFNYDLYRSGILISSGQVTINSAVSWAFTPSSGLFAFMASYGTDSSGVGTLTFYGIISAVFKGSDIIPVIGIPAPVAPKSGISLSQSGNYAFAPTTAGDGYTVPAALKVTITNTGDSATGELAITLSDDTAFTVDPSTIAGIAAGGTADFTVAPIAELEEGTYTATVTVSGGNVNAKTFNVRFTVTATPADPVYSIGLSVPAIHTFQSAQEDYGPQDALEVTITNTGNRPTGNLTLALSGDDAGSFALSAATIAGIDVGGTDTFKVTPNNGLRAKTHTATVTVSGENNISAGFTVSFKVNPVEPTYSIGLSESSLDFGSAPTGYEPQDAKPVTITNTGNRATGKLTVALSGDDAGSFTLSKTSINSIAVNGTAAFTVTPNNGLALGEYNAAVTVSGGNDISAGFTVSFKVNPVEPTYSIGLSESSLDFGSAPTGYEPQDAKPVTITNTGNQPTGALTVALSSSSAFTLSATSIGSIAVNGTAAFTVTPNTNLAVGTYTATVTVSAAVGNSADITAKSFSVSFNVIEATYGISLSVTDAYTFPEANAGYEAQTAKTVTITNTGNQPTGALTVSLSGADFEASASGDYAPSIQIDSIAAGAVRTFKVRPKGGLAAGTYTATVMVSGGNGISASFNVSFTVNPAPTYGISLSQSGTHTFPVAGVDYGAQSAKSVTINNTGNQPTGNLTLALSNSSAFTLSATSIGSISAGGSNSFTVTPKTSLAIGTYTATVTVSGDNGISASFGVSFTVYSSYLTFTDGSAIGLRADDLSALCNDWADTASITVNGRTIAKNTITGAVFGAAEFSAVTALPTRFLRNCTSLTAIDLSGFTGLTSIGERFLQGCTNFNGTLELPPNLTTIGNLFMEKCTSFNQPLTLPEGITSIGNQFLWGCTSFNQPLTLPEGITSIEYSFLKNCTAFNQPLVIPESVTSIKTYDWRYSFMENCTSFNQPLNLPGVTSIAASFMQNCTSFNSPLTMPNVRTIGDHFLTGCTSFNQPLDLPATVTSIGFNFLFNCKDMTSVVTLNCPATVFTTSSPSTFSTDSATANSYTTGITIAGPYKADIIARFPNRTSSPYRKLIEAPSGGGG